VIDFATWRAAWNDLGVEPHEPLHQRLIACWSEKHRHYHTLQHLREVLEGFEQVRVDAQRPAEIVLALWFHDAIYDLQRNDNEQRSAQWAKESLLQAGLPEEAAQRLYDLVMATRHDQPPADPDAQLLVDMDLAILGADRARFDPAGRSRRNMDGCRSWRRSGARSGAC